MGTSKTESRRIEEGLHMNESQKLPAASGATAALALAALTATPKALASDVATLEVLSREAVAARGEATAPAQADLTVTSRALDEDSATEEGWYMDEPKNSLAACGEVAASAVDALTADSKAL